MFVDQYYLQDVICFCTFADCLYVCWLSNQPFINKQTNKKNPHNYMLWFCCIFTLFAAKAIVKGLARESMLVQIQHINDKTLLHQPSYKNNNILWQQHLQIKTTKPRISCSQFLFPSYIMAQERLHFSYPLPIFTNCRFVFAFCCPV